MFDWDTSLKQSVKISIEDYNSDNVSIAFSVDPEMVTKLDIPVRLDQRSSLDYDKMYRYQLDRDLKKIVTKYGHFRDRDNQNIKARRADPEFAPFLEVNAGNNGDTAEIAAKTAQISWQATTQPFGPIAEKHHLARQKQKKKSLSETQTLEIRQKAMDDNLWDSIRFGYLEEKRVKKETSAQREERLKHEKKKEEEKKAEELLAKDPWKYRLERNQFSQMRENVTKFDIAQNMKNWDVGHHPEHNTENGFPKVAFVERNFAKINISEDSIMKADIFGANDMKKSIPDLYIPSRGIIGQKFRAAIVQRSYMEAEKLINKTKTDREKARRQAAKEKYLMDRNSNRRGHEGAEQMRMDALHALIALKIKEDDNFHNDDDSSDADNTLATEEKIQARQQARMEMEKMKNSLILNNSDVQDSTGKSVVRFTEDGHGNGEDQEGLYVDGSSVSSQSFDTFMTQTNGPIPQSPPKMTIKERLLAPYKAMMADIKEEGLEAYVAGVKERWSTSFKENMKKIVDPATELFRYAAGTNRRISPYENVDETQYLSAVAAELSIEESLNRLQAQVDELEADEEAFNKFSFKGYTEEAVQNRKRKLAKLRRRLAAKSALAEELRREAAEAAAKKIRDEHLAKAAAEVENVRQRYLIINQLTEAIRIAHENAQIAAATIGNGIAIEKKDEVGHTYLKEKMSKDKLAAGRKIMGAICRVRDRRREAASRFRDRLDFILGSRESYVPKPSVNELIMAVQSGDVNAVIDLIDTNDAPVSPNQKNQDGNSGMFAMLDILLRNEKAQGKLESLTVIRTPIQEVLHSMKRFVFGTNADVVNLSVVLQLLLYKGGDLNILRGEDASESWAIMHFAAQEGAVDFIDWLCSIGGDPNLQTSSNKYTPLMCSARKDQLDAALVILKFGGMDTIETRDHQGWTALHHAAACASPQFVQLLLLIGAKHNVRNDNGFSPTDEAESRSKNAVVEILRTYTERASEHMERLKFFQEMYKDYMSVDKFEHLVSDHATTRAIKQAQIDMAVVDEASNSQGYDSDDFDDSRTPAS